MMSTRPVSVLLLLLIAATLSSAFLAPSPPSRSTSQVLLRESWDSNGNNNANSQSSQNSVGAIEQIEFKIYPDGRVEETVRGVKGGNCQKVTEKINEQLGKVVNSAPTEEMFEEKVVLDQTLTNTEGTGGDSSWEGSSSW